jgi:hypothetical protein
LPASGSTVTGQGTVCYDSVDVRILSAGDISEAGGKQAYIAHALVQAAPPATRLMSTLAPH